MKKPDFLEKVWLLHLCYLFFRGELLECQTTTMNENHSLLRLHALAGVILRNRNRRCF
jgi:hypothetical protein